MNQELLVPLGELARMENLVLKERMDRKVSRDIQRPFVRSTVGKRVTKETLVRREIRALEVTLADQVYRVLMVNQAALVNLVRGGEMESSDGKAIEETQDGVVGGDPKENQGLKEETANQVVLDQRVIRDLRDEMAMQDGMDYVEIRALKDNLVIEVLQDLLGPLGCQGLTGVKGIKVRKVTEVKFMGTLVIRDLRVILEDME